MSNLIGANKVKPMLMNKEIVEYVREFLYCKDLLRFFRAVKAYTGRVDSVIGSMEALECDKGEIPNKDEYDLGEKDIPYPIHFREGMFIRNALRDFELCKNWTDSDFDDNWAPIVEAAIALEEESKKDITNVCHYKICNKSAVKKRDIFCAGSDVSTSLYFCEDHAKKFDEVLKIQCSMNTESKCIEPDRKGNMSIEEIKKRIEEVTQPEKLEEIRKWEESKPEGVRKIHEKFPCHALYRVKDEAPYTYSCGGSIVSIYSVVEMDGEFSPSFMVLRSPFEGSAGTVAVLLDPEWLEPITIEQLEKLDEDVPKRGSKFLSLSAEEQVDDLIISNKLLLAELSVMAIHELGLSNKEFALVMIHVADKTWYRAARVLCPNVDLNKLCDIEEVPVALAIASISGIQYFIKESINSDVLEDLPDDSILLVIMIGGKPFIAMVAATPTPATQSQEN